MKNLSLPENVLANFMIRLCVVFLAVLVHKSVELSFHMYRTVRVNKLLHWIESCIMAVSWSWESNARIRKFDLKNVTGKIFVTVMMIRQIIVIVVTSKKSVVASHLISNWNRHTRRWIFGRFLVTHPQSVYIFLLANQFFMSEFIALYSIQINSS